MDKTDTRHLRAAVRHVAAEAVAAERGIDTLQALRRIQSREKAEAFNRRNKPGLHKGYLA